MHTEAPREQPPHVPVALPFVGHAPYFMRDKLRFLTRCAAGGSSVMRLQLGGPTYLLNNAEDVRHVLVTNQRNYEKSPRVVGPLGKHLFGRGLLGAPSGASHLRERRA